MSWRFACLLLVLPLAMANGDHDSPLGDRVLERGDFLNHVQAVEAELGPGETRNWTMAFGGPAGGGVLHEGWYWVLRADVVAPCDECGFRARLSIDGQLLESWMWDHGPQQEITRVPFDGFLNLRLDNVGPDNATVRFYYDVTCDCVGKVVPAPAGPVWFNTEAEAGDEILFNFTVEPVQIQAGDEPSEITVRARHLVPDDLGGFVPKQEIRRTWSVGSDPSCTEKRWSACFDFAFEAQEDGMQLLLVETSHDGDTSWGTGLRPVIQEAANGRDAPLGLWILPLALALACRRR